METLTRRCKICGLDKPLDEFYARPQPSGNICYRTSCKNCMNEASRRRWDEDSEWRALRLAQNKAWDERNADRMLAYRKAYYETNRAYYAEKNKAWAQANRERRVAIRRKHVYGITQEQFDAMLADQEGKCAICRTDVGPRNWATDHDHANGAVRAILCRGCNLLLGYAGDDPELLIRAAEYLHVKELQIKTESGLVGDHESDPETRSPAA